MQQYIDKAVEQFRTLITEQLARQNRMEAGEQAKDFVYHPPRFLDLQQRGNERTHRPSRRRVQGTGHRDGNS